jgi:hypothetical protein
MSDWADVKADARRTVHETFAVRCLYRAPGQNDTVEVSARLHTRMVVGGAEGAGYATIVEGVTRVIFDREELIVKGVRPRRNGLVTFPDYGSSFALDVRDDYAGAITERWSLAGT